MIHKWTNIPAVAAVCLSILACCVLQACGRDTTLPDTPDDPAAIEALSMRMNFRIGRLAGVTGVESAEETSENFIDVENRNYRIYFFDTSDKFITEFNPLYVEAVDETASRDYTLTGRINPEMRKYHDFKVMLLANWPAYPDNPQPGVTTVADICDDVRGVFKRSDIAPADGGYIPFYGIRTFTGVKYSTVSGDIELSQPITLIRAVAKIVVELNTDKIDGNTKLTEVLLTGCNEGGYCAPDDVKSHDDYGEPICWTRAGMQPVHLYGASNEAASATRKVAFREAKRDDNGRVTRWELYVPEYLNITDDGSPESDDRRARISVRFTGAVSAQQYIDFKFYSDPGWSDSDMKKGDHFNIKRNYLYTFSLYKSKDRLEVVSDVAPYKDVELRPGFGLIRDEDTGMIIINKYAPDIYYYDDDMLRYYDSEGHELAHRVDRNADGVYIVRDFRANRFRYCYDDAKRKYYADAACTVPIVSPEQLEFPVNSKGQLIIRTNDFGEAIYFWDPVRGECLDENGSVVPLPCFAFQRWPENENYIVIDYTDVGRYRILYNPASNRYYKIPEDGYGLEEIQAFPPKN